MNADEKYTEPLEAPDSVEENKAPKGRAAFSLALGIASVILGGVMGLIFGIIGLRLGGTIIEKFPKASSVRLAKWGRITGNIGIVISVASIILTGVLIVIVAWLVLYFITGDPLLGLSIV